MAAHPPDEQRRSVWLADAPRTGFPALDQHHTADVAVVGGGITGLTTALLLQRAGLQVAVLEADRIGCGVTGSSTAKVTSLHNLIYARLERQFDRQAARIYAEANQIGLAQVAALAEEFAAAGDDCAFERASACTYTCQPDRLDAIHQEVEAARRAGLPARFVDDTELPWEVLGAVEVEDQGQFDPYRYCLGLANACARDGVAIFERSRVHDVEQAVEERVCRLHDRDATVRAGHVVVATLLPFLDRGGFFARTYPSRSYGLAATLDGPAPAGMYISADAPTRSVRRLPDGRGIVVVGEEHKVGQDPDTRQRYADLEAWTRAHFPVRSIDYRWSAQDYMAADGLPYIGRMPGETFQVLTATGFNKWGLSAATAAALILRDAVQQREHPWASLFDATRVDLLASARKLIEENANVAKRFIGDRLRSLASPEIEELQPGEGGIVLDHGNRVAAYRDEAGNVHACSPVCTHMGCFVQWNAAEKSWDCPCHGSRFDYRGEVLQGPALHPLEPVGHASER